MQAIRRLHVWDVPTRVFHWLLALAIPAAIATGMIGGELIVWHGRLGLAILGLVTFRLLWGFIGAPHARFASFVRGPRAIAAYLRGEWRGVGHNPLGALSVLAMLALIALQIGSGLFANDDIAYQGPLAHAASDDWSSRLTALHSLLQYGLIGVVLLHAAAIFYYVRVRREQLLRPMITGYKHVQETAPGTPEPARPRARWLAFLLASCVAGGAVYAASGALFASAPAPAAAPAAAGAPAW